MSVTGYTVAELKEIIASLKDAQKRAIKSGGVVQYTLNSGQGSSTVQQASLSTIQSQITYYVQLLNEELEYGSGSHCQYIRDMGVM